VVAGVVSYTLLCWGVAELGSLTSPYSSELLVLGARLGLPPGF